MILLHMIFPFFCLPQRLSQLYVKIFMPALPVSSASSAVLQNVICVSFYIRSIEWLLCCIIDLINPIHRLMLDSAGCLHVPAAGEVSSESGAFNDCKTTGMKQNNDWKFVSNEIILCAC